MQDGLVNALRSQRAQIRARWDDLLHVERAKTPLANPDALVHLLDWTLDEIFRALHHAHRRRNRNGRSDYHPECPCGRNPLLAYFASGEQALREALVNVQAATPHLDPVERDAALLELNLALQHIARREIEAFCGVCQFRAQEANCHHAHEPAPIHPPHPFSADHASHAH